MTDYADYIKRALANSALIDSGIVGHDLEKAVNAITAVPAADVRPEVRGVWVYEEPNSANSFNGCYWCDQCHQPIDHKKKFCPNCGADMREKEDGHDRNL